MGARTLEKKLRAGLLGVVLPAFLGIGAAAVGITARALDRVDEDAARARVATALRTMHTEMSEGDSIEVAAREVIASADAEGTQILLRGSGLSWQTRQRNMLPVLGALPVGECGTAHDDRGESWRGCAATGGLFTAVAVLPIEAHRAAVRMLAEWMLAIVAIALFGAVAAVRFAVRRPLASLNELVAWSERAVASDPSHGPPLADTAEIARLTASFDALVRRLVEALARERANSAHIAHELRTPLTGMRAELEAMPCAPDGKDAVGRMREDLARVSRVIDAILVLSSPRSATRSDETQVVNLADVARDLAPEGTKVDAPDEALVDADPRLIALAVHNLLENALKYSGHAAESIRVSRVEDGVRIAVLDGGPGLDAAARGKMFDRYWRGASDGSGSGLGLALVRAVAERHGGHADARPNPTGGGLEVAMTFPHLLGWN